MHQQQGKMESKSDNHDWQLLIFPTVRIHHPYENITVSSQKMETVYQVVKYSDQPGITEIQMKTIKILFKVASNTL